MTLGLLPPYSTCKKDEIAVTSFEVYYSSGAGMEAGEFISVSIIMMVMTVGMKDNCPQNQFKKLLNLKLKFKSTNEIMEETLYISNKVEILLVTKPAIIDTK